MIVIIEDDLVFVKNVVSKLKKNGIDDIRVFNSIQSYIHIEAELYLVDIRLEKNSFDLISEIRKQTNGVICIVSSYSEKEYIKKCFTNGADFYINKLVNPFLYQYKILGLYNMIKRLSSLQNKK